MSRITHWPHAPSHRFGPGGTFIVTAATYLKQHHFRSAERLAVLQRGLLAQAARHGWQLEAWAVFSNHYHFIAHSPVGEKGADSLRPLLGELHEKTAKWVSQLDGRTSSDRKVWHNYWETRLTFEKSYLARLSYVHRNAVRHGLVNDATAYPWCSAAWFERTASRSQIETVHAFDGTRLKVLDDYTPAPDW